MSGTPQTNAANDLEDLIAAAKQIVVILREGQTDRKAHALLYVLRRRLGHVVRGVGPYGEPYPQHRAYAEAVIDNETGK